MIAERINDPTEIPAGRIHELIAEKQGAVIQFSGPPKDPLLLRKIDSLCQKYGDALEVRFYGYYGEVFDGALLRNIPNVQNLSLDCLTRVGSLDGLFGLTKLTKLSLGIYALNDNEILAKIGIRHLREFSIGETKTCKIDLSPLAQCQDLTTLRIESQPKGMDVVQNLPQLKDLTLRRIRKDHSIAFASKIRPLKRLKVILGGRTDIDEVSHGTLEKLEIIWIQGLASLGNLDRFPHLQKLWVEDQLQLRTIDFDRAPAGLRELAIFNCKNLRTIGSLAELGALEDVRISRTALDFDEVASSLPKSVRKFRFWQGTAKRNAEIQSKLDALGYTQD